MPYITIPYTATEVTSALDFLIGKGGEGGTGFMDAHQKLERRCERLEAIVESFKIPQVCERCGAPLAGNKCEYCGTEYVVVGR